MTPALHHVFVLQTMAVKQLTYCLPSPAHRVEREQEAQVRLVFPEVGRVGALLLGELLQNPLVGLPRAASDAGGLLLRTAALSVVAQHIFLREIGSRHALRT